MLDPHQLRLFQEVALSGSYSAAARSVGVTQPAVTYQMKALEKAVGLPLVVRAGRRMQLTAAGTTLLAHAERVLAALRAAEDDLASLSATGSGLVRIAAFPSSCATLVPAAMAAMRRARPHVEVRLVQAEPPYARTLVRRGDVDLALCYRFEGVRSPQADTEATSRLEQREVLVEDMHLVLPMDHPAAAHRWVRIDQLVDATFVIASAQFADLLHRAAAAAGFTPSTLTMADDYVAMQSLVASGFGVALVPDLALRAHRDPRIVTRTLVDWPRRHVQVELWPDMLKVDAVSAMVDQLLAAPPLRLRSGTT